MFKFKKLTAIALVAVAAMGLLAGCGSEKSKMTQEAGVLRVGSETTFPPFEFTEGDKYVGFDVDLSEAIAKKLGLKMEFKSMGFDALIPAVQSGDIDMIAAGINATPEREKALDFSDVYFGKTIEVHNLLLNGIPIRTLQINTRVQLSYRTLIGVSLLLHCHISHQHTRALGKSDAHRIINSDGCRGRGRTRKGVGN